MGISKISVSNLFELFNHSIPLNLQEHTTIIYGPNGYGKTIILRMLNGLFNRNYSLFRTIPFQDFTVEFGSGQSLRVTHHTGRATKHDSYPQIEYIDDKGTLVDLWEIKRRPHPVNRVVEIADELPELTRVGPRSWRHIDTSETLDIDQVVDMYGDIMPSGSREKREPEWLTKIQKSNNVRFLNVERLVGVTKKRVPWGEQSRRTPAINVYSEELASNIQKTYTEYAAQTASLDRSFPLRLLGEDRPAKSTIGDLRRKLNELERKRKQLVDAGVLDKEAVEEPGSFEIRAQDKDVLSVYLADYEKKLTQFDELARKIDILRRIINNRFQRKAITVDRDKGFIFTSSNGKSIRPGDLSSGEQHEIIMLYELLFKVKSGTLFLIDEPELSLHVGWQMKLVSDLQEIAELGAFHILMATHSPQIINKRWDLTVELKGP